MKLLTKENKTKVKKAGVRAGAGLGAAGATQALLSKSPVNRKSLVGLGATVAAGVAGSTIAKKLQNRKKAKFSSKEITEFARKKGSKDKKKRNLIDRTGKIGVIGGGVTGALAGVREAKKLKMKGKLAIGQTVTGGLVGAALGGAAGSGIGYGIKKLTNKKTKFSNTELSTFGDFTVNASFPKTEIKETKPKTAVELAYEKIRNRDKLPDRSSSFTDNI